MQNAPALSRVLVVRDDLGEVGVEDGFVRLVVLDRRVDLVEIGHVLGERVAIDLLEVARARQRGGERQHGEQAENTHFVC